jgi:hypothetical protein
MKSKLLINLHWVELHHPSKHDPGHSGLAHTLVHNIIAISTLRLLLIVLITLGAQPRSSRLPQQPHPKQQIKNAQKRVDKRDHPVTFPFTIPPSGKVIYIVTPNLRLFFFLLHCGEGCSGDYNESHGE